MRVSATRQMLVLLLPILFLSPSSALRCYSNNCDEEDRLCVETCGSGQNGCLAIYRYVPRLGEVEGLSFGCTTLPPNRETGAQCHLETTGNSIHSCECNHELCNVVEGLIGITDHTAVPPPLPAVSPPPLSPNELICEIYNCTGDECFHGYEVCERGSCEAKYARDANGNYQLRALQCGSSMASEPRCVLDTASGEAEVSCICSEHICNSIRKLNFSNLRNVIGLFDPECDSLRCDHVCARFLNNATPTCLCRSGYLLRDHTNCVDIDECALDMDDCTERCINTEGSFRCGCFNPSHFVDDDGRTCSLPDIACPMIEPSLALDCVMASPDDPDNLFSCTTPTACRTEDGHGACLILADSYSNGSLQIRTAGCVSSGSQCRPDSCVLEGGLSEKRPFLLDCCCTTTDCTNNISINETQMITTTNQPTSDSITTPLNAPSASSQHVVGTAVGAGLGVAVVVVLLLVIFLVCCCCCKTRRKSLHQAMILESAPEVACSAYEGIDVSRIKKVGEHFARGRFGLLYRGISDVNLGIDLAIKVFEPREINKREVVKDSWKKEVNIYNRLKGLDQHPNILRFVGSQDNGLSWDIIVEYHERGSLSDVLKARVLTMEQSRKLMVSLTEGVKFLHYKANIAHRDLKSRNVLVTRNGESVISDFGLAITFPPSSDPSAKDKVGTPRYMAPEVLGTFIDVEPNVYRKIDIYALSFTLWEIVTRTHPPQVPLELIKPYSAPFEEHFRHIPTITIDQMAEFYRADDSVRPTIPSYLEPLPEFQTILSSIRDSWNREPQCRITSTCILERLERKNNHETTIDSGTGSYGSTTEKHIPTTHTETTV